MEERNPKAKLFPISSSHQKLLAILAVFTAFFLRLGWYVYHYGANIYYSDNWYINSIFPSRPNIFSLITQQYTAIFQGPAFILTYLLAIWTNFDARAENWHVFAYLTLSCLCAILLTKKSTKLSFFDISIPIIFFTVLDYEIVFMEASAPYVAPILYILIYCLICTRPWTIFRVVATSLLGYCLAFSGIGYIAIPLLCLHSIIEYRFAKTVGEKRLVIAAIASIIGITLIYVSHFNSGIANNDGVLFPKASASWLLAYFIHFFGANELFTPTIPFQFPDIFVAVFALVLSIYSWFLLVKKKRRTMYISCICMTYTLAVAVANTFGRAARGLAYAESSRYAVYFILFNFGIYMFLRQIQNRKARMISCCVFVLFLLSHEMLGTFLKRQIVYDWTNSRHLIRTCVQTHKNISDCDSLPDTILVDVYVADTPEMQQFILDLQKRRANLYAR